MNNDFNTILQTINSRFYKEVSKLGFNNSKGTLRHELETEFCYLLREVADDCPTYSINTNVGNLLTFCGKVKQTVKEHLKNK